MPSWSVLTSGWGKGERAGKRKKAGRGRALRLDSREKGGLQEGVRGWREKEGFVLYAGKAKEGETGIWDGQETEAEQRRWSENNTIRGGKEWRTVRVEWGEESSYGHESRVEGWRGLMGKVEEDGSLEGMWEWQRWRRCRRQGRQ